MGKWIIFGLILLITGCSGVHRIEGPICVAYLHRDHSTKDVKWFIGESMTITPYDYEYTGNVWNAKQVVERPRDIIKKDSHLPWGLYRVALDMNGGMYFLTGMAVGNCVFIWPNSLSDKDFESLK